MQAVQVDGYGGPEALQMREVPDPTPGAGQIVVRIHATSFNPLDAKLVSGAMKEMMPLTFPWTPGGDLAGVVETLGEDVEGFRVGDAVYAYSPTGGAYAEKIAIDAKLVALKPQSVSHAEAASLALVTQTASQALDAAHLEAGQTVLIQGASGGVGMAAVQIARGRGVRVIATASAAEADPLTALGADQVIDYKATPFETVVHGVDAVLDGVGGDTQQRSFGVLKPGGYLVALSQPPSPDEAAKHNVHALMLQTQPSGEGLKAIAEKIDAGEIKPTIGKTYPLAQVATAWQEASSQHTAGKIALTVGNT